MIRLGVWGCGAMGTYHAKRFAALSGFQLSTCLDRDRSRAVSLAQSFGIPHVADDATSFLTHCDAVACALIDKEHSAAGLAVAGAGLPLFLEKPMARNSGESLALHEAFLGKSPLVVNFSKRNSPALAEVRRLVGLGSLGKLMSIRCHYLQSWLVDPTWGDWRHESRWQWRTTEEASCYGVLGDLASHLFDATLYLLGQAPVTLTTASGTRTPQQETVGGAWESASLKGHSGKTALSWEVSRCARGHLDTMTLLVEGTLGTCFLDLESHRAEVLFGTPEASDAWRPVPETRSTYDSFLALCQGAPTEEVPTGADGHRVQLLLDEAHALLLAGEGP